MRREDPSHHRRFASSVVAYGEAKADALRESSPSVPSTASPIAAIYGTTKLLGEALGRVYQQKFGIEFYGMCFSSVCGERQHERTLNANGIAAVHDQISCGEAPVIVGDGSKVHDYIHVADVASSCCAAMLNGPGGGTLNLVTGQDTTHAQLARAMIEVCGASHMTPLSRKDTRTCRSAGGSSLNFSLEKTRGTIGWSSEIPQREGLRRYLAWRGRPDL